MASVELKNPKLVSQCHATSHGAFAQLVELATVLLRAASFSIYRIELPTDKNHDYR